MEVIHETETLQSGKMKPKTNYRKNGDKEAGQDKAAPASSSRKDADDDKAEDKRRASAAPSVNRHVIPGAVAAMLRAKCENTARSRLFMRLHGMRRASQSLSDETPLPASARRGSRPESRSSVLTQSTVDEERPDSRHNQLPWKRRHSELAALKNAEWSHFYLSTAATDETFGAFLTLKSDAKSDAEYFMCFMPKVVSGQSGLYKELLAVYNALHYWTVRRPLFADKHILIAVYNGEAARLLTKAKIVDSLVAAEPLKLLIEIAALCRKHRVEYRIAESDPDVLPSDTITYSVIRLNEVEHRRRFAALLDFQTRIKGSKFNAHEQLFPPVYVL